MLRPRRVVTLPRLLGCALLALMSACASLSPPQPSGAAQTAAAEAYQGRFAVRYVQNGETKNAYGNFEWTRHGDAVTLQLLNPLGQTQAIIRSAPGAATLELPGRAPLAGPRLEDVMRRALGFALPVSGMRYWLSLQVAPDSPGNFERDANGRPTRLQQDGWTIDYQSYFDGTPPRVKQLSLSRDLQGEPLNVRLVINP